MLLLSLIKTDMLGHNLIAVIQPSLTKELTHHKGPLHTRAKSRDHEIVTAQKKASQGRPNTPPTSCSVVMDPQSVV